MFFARKITQSLDLNPVSPNNAESMIFFSDASDNKATTEPKGFIKT